MDSTKAQEMTTASLRALLETNLRHRASFVALGDRGVAAVAVMDAEVCVVRAELVRRNPAAAVVATSERC